MKTLMSAYSPDIHSEDFVTENPRQLLRHQLARVIAINLVGLALFIVFCAIMTVGSPSVLLTYWNQHRAVSVVLIMTFIVSIPCLVGLVLSRREVWQT
jgi:hypothetical protein